MPTIEIIPESIKLIKITDKEYFNNYKEYISNSMLGLIDLDNEKESIEKLKKGFTDSYNKSFEIGSAVHNMVLQPDYYTVSNIKKPNGKLGLFSEEVLKYRRLNNKISDSINKASIDADYYSGKLTNTRLKTAIKSSLNFYLQRNKIEDNDKIMYLSQSVFNTYEKCIESFNKSASYNLIHPTSYLFTEPEVFNEYAIFCDLLVKLENKEIILKIKGKLDNFTINHESNTVTLNDLKVTGKPINFFMGNKVIVMDYNDNPVEKWFDGSFQKYNYHRQLGMYIWLLQSAIQKEFGLVYKYNSNIIAIESIPNYSCKTFPINNSHIKKGLTEMKTLFLKIAEWKIRELI